MKRRTIKKLMVPISEYASVFRDATLFQAIAALKSAQRAYDGSKYLHRAILVLDNNQQVVGKISQLDALRALEPQYSNFQLSDSPTAFRHFTRSFLKSMIEQYRLLDKPFDDICRKAAELKVTDVMQTPTEGEYLDESATLDEAIHLLIMGHHQSMLVTRNEKIVGILRLTDIFSEVFDNLDGDCGESEKK